MYHTLHSNIQLLSNIEIIFQTIRCIPHLKDWDVDNRTQIIQTSTCRCKPVKWQNTARIMGFQPPLTISPQMQCLRLVYISPVQLAYYYPTITEYLQSQKNESKFWVNKLTFTKNSGENGRRSHNIFKAHWYGFSGVDKMAMFTWIRNSQLEMTITCFMCSYGFKQLCLFIYAVIQNM